MEEEVEKKVEENTNESDDEDKEEDIKDNPDKEEESNIAAQKEHVRRRTAAFSYLLEKKFVPLAMNKGKKIIKGSKQKRNSSVNINIHKIGQEVEQEQEEGQEKESSSSSSSSSSASSLSGRRRKSVTANAAEILERAIAGRNSLTLENLNFTSANEKLLKKFNKPLKVVFNFYATLTKVAPNKGNSKIPSNVVRTHLTYSGQKFLKPTLDDSIFSF